MRLQRLCRATAGVAIAVLAMVSSLAARAAEISVLVNMGDEAVVEDLGRAFAAATGNTVTVRFMLGNSLALANQGGVPADVFSGSPESIDDYMRTGEIVAGSRTDFARAETGLSVKAGDPRPDISTPEALKRTLLAARSIGHSGTYDGTVAYSASSGEMAGASSGVIAAAAVQKLGIAAQLRPRTRLINGVPVGIPLAKGEVQYGIQQVNVLRQVPGTDYVGPLPGELQVYMHFSLGVLAISQHRDVAQAFLRFAAARKNAAIIRRNYLEPWSAKAGARQPARR